MYIRNNWSLTPFLLTILFITHQLPKGLKVDDAVILGKQQEENNQGKSKNEGA